MKCRDRWRAVGAWWVRSDTDAEVMDVLVLAPLLALLGAALPLPQLLRRLLVCGAGGLLIYNGIMLCERRR